MSEIIIKLYFLVFILTCILLNSGVYAGDNYLASGEVLCPVTDSVPKISMNKERGISSGGMLDVKDKVWILSDTSSGRIPNKGTTFEISYGRKSSIVSQINDILRLSVGSEPVDFLVCGSVKCLETAGDLLVGVNLSGKFIGKNSPGVLFPKTIELDGNAEYEIGNEFRLEKVTPRTRFRIWPSGGTNTINGLKFSIDIRVDNLATPETISISDFDIFRIDKRGVSDIVSKSVILCTEGMPPAAFIDTWRQLGIHVRTGLSPQDGEKVVGIYADNIEFSKDEVNSIVSYIERGIKLFISTGANGGIPAENLARLLPVNAWSFKRALKRRRCIGAVKPEAIKQKSIPFSARFDMHLPGSAIESPLFRYRPEKYLRDRKKFTRTSVVMECEADGCLPLLIDADVGRSRILILASSYEDTLALTSPEYYAWADFVAKLPFSEKLPDDSLNIESPIEWAMRKAMQPFSIDIEEDESTLDELSQSPSPKDGIDGIISYRYVYRPGTSPKIKLRLRNHFNNIAPLAEAQDIMWSKNPSASGLNDLSFTHASVRGKLPIHPIWCGRQSEKQRIALIWNKPVIVCGMRLTGGGNYRFWFKNNPEDFSVISGTNEVFSITNAPFVNTAAIQRSVFEKQFGQVLTGVTSLELLVENLDPAIDREPRRDWPSNCSVTEWEVWGWAGLPVEEKFRKINLLMEIEDLNTGVTTTNDLGNSVVAVYSEKKIEVLLETKNTFGPVQYRFIARDGENILAKKNFDVIYVPAAGTKLDKKIKADCKNVGLLCTPGWRQNDSFGLGMNDWSSGWGGAHDQTWAFTQDICEMGMHNKDEADRMFTSATRASHYTNPWRCFLNGIYTWDWVSDKLLMRMMSENRKQQSIKKLHVLGSDRWNGVNVGKCFGWDVFVDFDLWLRANGESGLHAKSRNAIVKEIRDNYGDKWQEFNMNRYTDKMLQTKHKFAAHGFEFSYETHGSFPMAGGELGRKLAETHVGVGTDVFWELRRQDLWRTLAGRIAVVAANPNLRSGAYDEWGWVNSEQNEFWFGSNGDTTVARRQWYATYFLGRVTLDGEFRPYHEMGFSSQGNHGVRYNANDHLWRTRVHNLVTQLRPEKPSGFGLVVSWRGQERRMGPKLGRQGFGLYPEAGEDDLESLCEAVYTPLVKQGLPISFVTSTYALEKWNGKNPLILVDALNWEDWEIDVVKKLQKAGVTVISIGASHPKLVNSDAIAFFSEERIADANGGGILSWNNKSDSLDSISAKELINRIMNTVDNPIRTSRGLTVVPFVSHNTLFLAVCRQGDDKESAYIIIKPKFFNEASQGSMRVVSLDDGKALPVVKLDSGVIRVDFPMEDSSGRILMFCPLKINKNKQEAL